jgi:hypothetical protein
MKVWKPFAQSKKVRIICFAVAGALLAASAVGLWQPAPAEVKISGAAYEDSGRFDYTVYLEPSTLYGSSIQPEEEQAEGSLVFFRNIIDYIDLLFSYSFDCSEPLASIDNRVVVTATVENPGMWQKDMPLLEETHKGREFEVDFPLNVDSLENVAEGIEEEIGITSSERNFVIKATVYTTAETGSGKTIEDDFSHEITAILDRQTLELKGNLGGSDRGFEEGVSYEAAGQFGYEVYLKPNKLYGSTVLRSQGPPQASSAPPSQTLGPGQVYYPKIIDTIEATFYYQFFCDRPLSGQSEEVEVSAIIENPGKWSKSLVVVPKTKKMGNFAVSFPIDIHYFNDVIDAIERETGAGGGTYNLEIKADVHTTAETDLGSVNEVYSQSLKGKLEGNTLSFGEELSQSQTGIIGEATPGPSPENIWGSLSLAGLIVALLALGYFGWSYIELRQRGAGIDVEVEAARARKKYRQVLVDVEELPAAKPNETLIPLGSLDDLVRVADDLVKPVLHHVEEGRHVYCTVDGAVRYQYTSQPQD